MRSGSLSDWLSADCRRAGVSPSRHVRGERRIRLGARRESWQLMFRPSDQTAETGLRVGSRLFIRKRQAGERLARRNGDATSVLDWRASLVCSRRDSRSVDMVLTGARGLKRLTGNELSDFRWL